MAASCPELRAHSWAPLTEARLAATLNHPNVVQTFEVVLLPGRPVLLMEYVEEQRFSQILRGEYGTEYDRLLAGGAP